MTLFIRYLKANVSLAAFRLRLRYQYPSTHFYEIPSISIYPIFPE